MLRAVQRRTECGTVSMRCVVCNVRVVRCSAVVVVWRLERHVECCHHPYPFEQAQRRSMCDDERRTKMKMGEAGRRRSPESPF